MHSSPDRLTSPPRRHDAYTLCGRRTTVGAVLQVVTLPTVLGYAYWLAPEVAGERVETLRQGLRRDGEGSAFLADAQTAKMMITPQTGPDLAELVSRAAGMPKHVLAHTASLLEWKE